MLLSILVCMFLDKGGGMTKDPENNGSKHSAYLNSFLFLYGCNFGFLLSSSNVWSWPHFQKIY